jgi:O-antigen/teichoic acid export membrane protein
MPKALSSDTLFEIKRKTITGAIQLIIREIFIKVTVAIGQLLLVRLLAPSVFGIFAILSFILSTAEIFTDIGLSLAIIQKKEEPTRLQLSSIFYIKLGLAIITVLVLNVTAPVIISYYHQLSSFETLMLRLLSLTLIIKPLPNVISSLLERELRYKDIAVIDVCGIISYYAVSLLFAFLGFGIWSFIIAVISKTLIECVTTFFFKPFVPLFRFNYKSVKEFINIGKYFQLGFFLTIIHNAVIPVIAGPRVPLSQVGFLDWSYNTASFPRVFIDNLGRVSFSSFSRIQDNKELISSSIEKALDILTVVTAFFIVAVLVFGNDLIHYFLNDKWIFALPALNWYVVSIFFMNGTGLLGHALLALGKTKEILISVTIITVIEFFGSFLLLHYFGFSGIAFGFFLIVAATYFTYVFLCNYTGLSIHIGKTLIASSFIFLSTFIFMNVINTMLNHSFLDLLIKLLFSFLLYLLLVRIAFPDSFRQTLNLLKIRGENIH